MSKKAENPAELEKKLNASEERARELELALSKKEDELKENVSLLQRTHADFQNYMKHAEKERNRHAEKAVDDLLLAVIEVHENLGRAIEAMQATEAHHKTRGGISAVARQLAKLLEERGVRRVESIGSAFNPGCHEAVEALESSGKPENTVIEEVQSGYTVNNRLLRPAKVIVAKKKGGA